MAAAAARANRTHKRAMGLQFAGDADAARDAAFLERVKAALGLRPGSQLELQSATQDKQGKRTIEYTVTQPVTIQGKEFGAADGVVVDERMIASLRFDARGALVSSKLSPIDARHLQLVKDQIRKLAQVDEIYLAQPNQKIDTDALRAQRKPWYVEVDAQGRKRLKRAYIA